MAMGQSMYLVVPQQGRAITSHQRQEVVGVMLLEKSVTPALLWGEQSNELPFFIAVIEYKQISRFGFQSLPEFAFWCKGRN